MIPVSLKVNARNEAELPADVVRELNAGPGDELRVFVSRGNILIVKQVPDQLPSTSLRGSLSGYPQLSDLSALRPRDEEDDLAWT